MIQFQKHLQPCSACGGDGTEWVDDAEHPWGGIFIDCFNCGGKGYLIIED